MEIPLSPNMRVWPSGLGGGLQTHLDQFNSDNSLQLND